MKNQKWPSLFCFVTIHDKTNYTSTSFSTNVCKNKVKIFFQQVLKEHQVKHFENMHVEACKLNPISFLSLNHHVECHFSSENYMKDTFWHGEFFEMFLENFPNLWNPKKYLDSNFKIWIPKMMKFFQKKFQKIR